MLIIWETSWMESCVQVSWKWTGKPVPGRQISKSVCSVCVLVRCKHGMGVGGSTDVNQSRVCAARITSACFVIWKRRALKKQFTSLKRSIEWNLLSFLWTLEFCRFSHTSIQEQTNKCISFQFLHRCDCFCCHVIPAVAVFIGGRLLHTQDWSLYFLPQLMLQACQSYALSLIFVLVSIRDRVISVIVPALCSYTPQ